MPLVPDRTFALNISGGGTPTHGPLNWEGDSHQMTFMDELPTAEIGQVGTQWDGLGYLMIKVAGVPGWKDGNLDGKQDFIVQSGWPGGGVDLDNLRVVAGKGWKNGKGHRGENGGFIAESVPEIFMEAARKRFCWVCVGSVCFACTENAFAQQVPGALGALNEPDNWSLPKVFNIDLTNGKGDNWYFDPTVNAFSRGVTSKSGPITYMLDSKQYVVPPGWGYEEHRLDHSTMFEPGA